MATTRPGPAPPAGGARGEEESRAEPLLATCSCHGSSKRRAAEVSDPLHIRVHCPRDPWRAPADRATSSHRTKPREPGGRRSLRGSHRQGGSRLQSPCCTCQPPSGQPGTTMGATCSSFFVQRLSGEEVPSTQLAGLPSARLCPQSLSLESSSSCPQKPRSRLPAGV